MYIRWATFIFILLCGSGAWAQFPLQIASPGILNMPNNAAMHNSVSFQYNLRNLSATTYTGVVHTVASINGTVITALDTVFINGLGPNQNQHISVSNMFIDTLNHPFVIGRNGIVIWVADDNLVPISDSVIDEILVIGDDALSILGTSLPNPVLAYPNELRDVAVTVQNISDDLQKTHISMHAEVNFQYVGFLTSSSKVTMPALSVNNFDVVNFSFDTTIFQYGPNTLRLWCTGENGLWALDTLILEVEVSVANSIFDETWNGVDLYPNPTYSSVTLPFLASGGSVQVYDLRGNLMLTRKDEFNIDLKAAGLAAGTYLVRFADESGRMHAQKITLLP